MKITWGNKIVYCSCTSSKPLTLSWRSLCHIETSPFHANIPFLPPWFRTFSGGIEKKHWHETSEEIKARLNFLGQKNIQAIIYISKVNNRNTRKRCETCAKLRIKTPERYQCHI